MSRSELQRLRILIVSSYYAPEPAGTAPYVTGMAEYLAARGHQLDVVTTFAHYPDWRSSAGRRFARRERLNGVTVRRRALYVPHTQSVRERAMYEASMLGAGLTALAMRTRPDAVIGLIPSLAAGLLTALAGRMYRAPYGLIVHDLVGAGARQSGVSAGDRVGKFVSSVEGHLARRADGVAVIADAFRPYYEALGVPSSRLRRVRTWTRRQEPTEPRDATRARLGWPDEAFVCVHAGNMGQKQGLDNVLGAAARLRDSGVRVVFVGDGNDRARLQARASAKRLDNISFLPIQGPGDYEAVLQGADALLVNQRTSVGDMSLPSKLTSYFASGVPIVAAVAPESETAREIHAASAGVVVPADSPADLAEALLAQRNNPAAAALLGERGRAYARQILDRERILQAYEDFVWSVARAGGEAP